MSPSVDAQDLAILASFARAPRATYGEVGQRVGLSGNAVKSRIKRLTDEGVLQGFAALPEPALLGLAEGLLVFQAVEDLDEREEEILRSLPDVAGVVFVDVAIDHSVYVWTLHGDANDADRIERAAISLIGKPPALRVLGPPPAPRAPATADWRVARALLPDARATLKDLGARSGLSFKTLQRRLRSLFAERAVRVEPVLSGTEATGAVLFRLIALVDGEAPRDLFPEDALVTRVAGGRVYVAEMQRPTVRAANDEARRLRAQPSVERAMLQIATRRRFAAWLDEALAARMAAVAPPAPKAPLAPVPRPPR